MSLTWMTGNKGVTDKHPDLLTTSLLVVSNEHLLKVPSYFHQQKKLTYFTEFKEGNTNDFFERPRQQL